MSREKVEQGVDVFKPSLEFHHGCCDHGGVHQTAMVVKRGICCRTRRYHGQVFLGVSQVLAGLPGFTGTVGASRCELIFTMMDSGHGKN